MPERMENKVQYCYLNKSYKTQQLYTNEYFEGKDKNEQLQIWIKISSQYKKYGAKYSEM